MTNEGETPEAKSAHEPTEAHADDDQREMEGVGGHVDGHTTDDHGHHEERLGPIDWAAWGYALLGIAAGLVVVFFLWLGIT